MSADINPGVYFRAKQKLSFIDAIFILKTWKNCEDSLNDKGIAGGNFSLKKKLFLMAKVTNVWKT